jgi:hypothetical protein
MSENQPFANNRLRQNTQPIIVKVLAVRYLAATALIPRLFLPILWTI